MATPSHGPVSSSALSLVPAPLDPCVDPAADTIPDTLRSPTAPPPSGPRLLVRKPSRRRHLLCDHQWQPIPNWMAHYHCALCGAHGRRRSAAEPPRDDDSRSARHVTSVHAVRCTKRFGKRRCGACATVDDHDGWRCPKHSGPRQGRAERARLARSAVVDGAGTQVLTTYADAREPHTSPFFDP